jgi:hypothetical protein
MGGMVTLLRDHVQGACVTLAGGMVTLLRDHVCRGECRGG